MNPGQFIGLIAQPDLLDKEARAGLDEIIREYPFCQAAQLLYLKSLQVEGSVRFGKQLKIAAIYAGNRKALFDLLELAKPPAISPGKVAPEPVPAQLPEIADPVQNPDQLADEEFIPFELVPFLETPPENPAKALRSAYIEQLERFVPITPVDLLSFDFSPAENEILDNFLDEPARAETLKKPDHQGSGGQSDLAEFRFEDSARQVKPSGSGHDQDQSELIDRFIAGTSSKVLRPDTAPLSDEDRSLASLREDEEILTETLARIYIQQGYYMKAIMSYQKLSLKYPEKSIYFASQIEMVRELIKNQ